MTYPVYTAHHEYNPENVDTIGNKYATIVEPPKWQTAVIKFLLRKT